MGKKGFLLNIIVVLGLVIACTWFLLMQADNNREGLGSKNYIGQKQIDMLKLFPKAELFSLYYEHTGNYILPLGLYNLGSNGGFSSDIACGTTGVYNLWHSKEENCEPNPSLNLPYYLNLAYKGYSSLFNKNISNLGVNDYIFSVEKKDPVVVDAVAVQDIVLKNDGIKYSIKPNFKSSLNYNLNLYDTLYKKSNKLKDECINELDYQSCVEKKMISINSETKSLFWDENCEEGYEFVVNDFLEQYQNCFFTLDDDCICKINMHFDDKTKNKKHLKGKYKIKLTKEGDLIYGQNKKVIYSKEQAKEFVSTLLGMSADEVGELEFTFDYDKNLINISANGVSYQVSSLQVYKNYIENPFTDKLKYSFIVDDKQIENNNLHKLTCNSYPRTAKICVNDLNKYSFFNFETNQIVKRNIPIKFGIYFNDTFPPSSFLIKDGLKAENKPDSERKILLFFPSSKEHDVYKYNVYVSESDFKKSKILNFKEVSGEPSIQILSTEYEYPMIVNVPDDRKYYFAVTAEDVFGNENKTVQSFSGVSEDNLAPGPVKMKLGLGMKQEKGVIKYFSDKNKVLSLTWDKPELNVDASTLEDLDGYFVFVSNNNNFKIPSGITKNSCMGNCYFTKDTSLSVEVLKGNNFIYIYAVDEVPNFSPLPELNNYNLQIAQNYFYQKTRLSNLDSSVFSETKSAEGGWVCDPDDSGGETYKGITINYNKKWSKYSQFWNSVHQKIKSLFSTTDYCSLSRPQAKKLSRELDSDSNIQSLVNKFYLWYLEKYSLNKVNSVPTRKLIFNFMFNTPYGATYSTSTAVTGQEYTGKYAGLSNDVVNSLNSYNSKQLEDFAYKFAKAMYSYYSTKQEKFRRGWYKRLKIAVNQYLVEIGSDKRIIITGDSHSGEVVWK